MKKAMLFLIVLQMLITLGGCARVSSSLEARQQKAVDNSLKFINDLGFPQKDYIDTDIIEFENANSNTWRAAYDSQHKEVEEGAVDLDDWVITIGDTSGHAFVFIVCDSETSEVIGYIPIA